MGKRLLVVDSDRRFIQDHKSPLESAFEVDFLYATEGALTRLEGGQYGAILLCVETSENKGYALCAAIRRTIGDLKIALISAKASEEEYARHRGTKGKADLYLHKPITSNALIPALAEFVPMREDDPDNPLGDLAGADLGDEWLESLKSELETDFSTTAQPKAITPAPAWTLPVTAERTAAPTQPEVELLEWRTKELELKLAARYEELERKNQQIEELILTNTAVTRNLDEAQQAQNEAALLSQKILDQERAAGQLREDLQAALDERRRQMERLEQMNGLLSEKDQQNADLLESHQLLQAQLEEAREAGDRARALETNLAQAQERIRGLEVQAVQSEQDLLGHQAELTAKQAKIHELEGAQSRAEDLERELAGVRADLSGSLARIEALEPAQSRCADLERELASAQDQVSFQELTLKNLVEQRNALQADRDHQDEVMHEQAGEVMVLQEQLALLEASGRDVVEERDRLQERHQQAQAAAASLEQRLAEATAAHETQQRELLAGFEGRENRLNASLDTQRERINQMEQDKARLEALLQSRNDRLQAITTVLTELEGKALQALDLAKAVTN